MQATPEDHRFPCTKCGASLRFAPGTAALICDHCGHRQSVRDAAKGSQPIAELDFRRAVEARLPDSDIVTIRSSRCPNCGAEVAFDPAVHAAECPFCATPVVADTGASRQIKPQGLVAFELPEPDARAAMAKWLGSLWFAPSRLVEYARKGRQMQGVYVPFWTFDAATTSDYSGQRGTVYHETREVERRGKDGQSHRETRRVEKIRWQAVSGRVTRFFDDVLVLATQSLPKSHTEALMPWDLARLEPYRPDFLAGFRAESYTVGPEQGMTEARAQMDRVIAADIRADIGGDRQQIAHIDTEISAVTFKHILLPVWTAAYRYRGRSFRFVVNGQTGKVQGERPWSAVKIAVALVLLAALIAGGAYLSQHQQ